MSTNIVVGTDAANLLQGTAGRDLIYGFDPDGPQGQVSQITAARVATGLSEPVFAGAPAGDLERLFVVERGGQIKILDLGTGQILATPFLNLTGQVATAGEGGLLGLAFDPGFDQNGYFYVNLINTSGDTEIRRYQVSNGDANVANLASATAIIAIDQPAGLTNHKAGWLGFGPDGFLYAALGDGGGGGDPGNNAQNINSLLGKMLRLDVHADAFPGDAARNYAIPADNPFVGIAGADEIWALGLRNPWRDSFDRGTGTLFIADVGQGAWEEIDIGAAGANYGWRTYEGPAAFSPGTQLGGGVLTAPIHVYDHNTGHSITGGYVYRGESEGLQGQYFFADFVNQRYFTLHYNGSTWDATERTAQIVASVGTIGNPSSFGEDGRGNLYLVDLTGGSVFLLTPVVTSADQADSIAGLGGDDMLFGGSGNDVLDGGSGADTMNGGAGDDTYLVDDPGDLVTEGPAQGTMDTILASVDYTLPGGSGVDILRAAGVGPVNLTGNQAANLIYGNAGANVLDGKGGDDVLDGGGGSDVLRGGAGNDTFIVDSNFDVVEEAANQGIDTLRASTTYVLAAGQSVEILELIGAGDHNLVGNALDNSLFGNAGNNVLVGGGGRDLLAGGAGNDVYSVDSADDVVVEASGEGIDRVQTTVSYALGAGSEIEYLELLGAADLNGIGNELGGQIIGNAGANSLVGMNGDDILLGNGGDDRLFGGAATGNLIQDSIGGDGADTLAGGDGNDTLNGGGGADSLFGGPGDDFYIAYSVGLNGQGFTIFDTIIETAGNGIDTVLALHHFNMAADANQGEIERLYLGSLDGTSGSPLNGVGSNSANRIQGTATTNVIYGLGGNDTVLGMAGDDFLYGNDGADTISGGAGDDRLAGGTGSDIYNGEAGNDTFVWRAGDGIDFITDFAGAGLAVGDVVLLQGTGVANFAQLLPLIYDIAGGSQIVFNSSNVIVFSAVAKAQFDASDFAFA